MATVAYLLGAGASAQCIPVVNGMASDLEITKSKVVGCFYRYDDFTGHHVMEDESKSTLIKLILEDLQNACETHYSIDTYAKKLFLTNPEKFKQLKFNLSLYFTLKQVLEMPDKRYDNFFSSILNKDLQLPSKVKVISWNYDFQLERSYLEFNDSLNLDSSRDHLGMSCTTDWGNHNRFFNKFNVIKLNGSARIKTDNHDGYLFNDIKTDRISLVRDIIDKYLNIRDGKSGFDCELKFAWENENYEHLFSSSAPDLATVSVLVVIGYSFPFFNREVDTELFNRMTALKKIYVQDVNPENVIETMAEFIDLSGRHKQAPIIIPKRNLEQFVFPKELDVTS